MARIINRSNSMQQLYTHIHTHTHTKKRGRTKIRGELEVRLLEREMTSFEDNKIQNLLENSRASRSSQRVLTVLNSFSYFFRRVKNFSGKFCISIIDPFTIDTRITLSLRLIERN